MEGMSQTFLLEALSFSYPLRSYSETSPFGKATKIWEQQFLATTEPTALSSNLQITHVNPVSDSLKNFLPYEGSWRG